MEGIEAILKEGSSSSSTSKKLPVSWQFNAAMLSRPVDLGALVALSRTNPKEFLDNDLPHKMVTKLLNNEDETRSDRVSNRPCQ